MQTSMDRCTQLVLHPLRNVQPVQIVMQEMAESAVVLQRVADDASGSIQYALELVCGGLGPPPPSENGAAVVASCPRLQRAPRRDESIVQGVTRVSGGGARSVLSTITLLENCSVRRRTENFTVRATVAINGCQSVTCPRIVTPRGPVLN